MAVFTRFKHSANHVQSSSSRSLGASSYDGSGTTSRGNEKRTLSACRTSPDSRAVSMVPVMCR
jgi:hypothetical protein